VGKRERLQGEQTIKKRKHVSASEPTVADWGGESTRWIRADSRKEQVGTTIDGPGKKQNYLGCCRRSGGKGWGGLFIISGRSLLKSSWYRGFRGEK